MDDPEELLMPRWLHFNAPGLEFWGNAPDTEEPIQHAMTIVHRGSGEVVGQLLVVVARLDDVVNAQRYPKTVSDTHGALVLASPSSKLATVLSQAYGPNVFGGIMPRSFRSIATSHTGTDLSSSGSLASVVFHLARDDMHFFVIPANAKFCFEVPNLQANTAKSTLGRAVVSPYAIQMDETSEVLSVPLWLHFVAQSREFWGEAPDVVERMRIGVKVVHRETGEVVTRLLIIVARLDDVGSLQTELDYERGRGDDGLSVVEEVSSVDSNESHVKEKGKFASII
jgi:hypothetical protein